MVQRNDIFDTHAVLWPLKLNQFFIRLNDEDAGKLIKAISWFMLADPRAKEGLQGNERLEEYYDDIETILLKKTIQNQVRKKIIDREEVPEFTQRLYNKKLYMAPSGRIRLVTEDEAIEEPAPASAAGTHDPGAQAAPGPAETD